MNALRSLEPGDIPQIVALRRRAFGRSSQTSDEELARYYRMLFFENPWQDERYPSLVQEGSDGDILGFVGAIPRPMLLGGERITAITSTELMVAPEARGLIGPKLFRRLFNGAQHVTFSDRSNEQARSLYESLGGSAALWYSLYWAASLDGSRLTFETAVGGGASNLAVRALRRASRSLDRLSAGSITGPSVTTSDEPLAAETVIRLIAALGGKNTLVPEYETRTFEWLMQRLVDTQKPGRVVSAQVHQNGDPIGWFVYAIRPDREAEVVQLAALPGRESLAFDHLIHHAVGAGATVLRGRLDRRFARVISERGLPLTLGQPWTVVRSTRPDVAAQFLTGNAFFSRLDAEWWIGT